jgi:hypothetical protein
MPAGRPKGSKSLRLKSVRLVLAKMQAAGRLTPERLLERLFEIGLSDDPDRVRAIELGLAYAYGRPSSKIDLDVKHGIDESVVTILARIADSDAHRANLEAIQRRRDLRALPSETIPDGDA